MLAGRPALTPTGNGTTRFFYRSQSECFVLLLPSCFNCTHRDTHQQQLRNCVHPPSCVQSKPANPNSERKMRLIILQRSTVRFSPPQFSAVRWKKNFSWGVGSSLCHSPAFCLLVVSNVRLILLSCLLFKIFIFYLSVCVRGEQELHL